METFTLERDTEQLACYLWECPRPWAEVLVLHGMAEHARRYDRFAQALNQAGLNVVSMDLRGHGGSIRKQGWFAASRGWDEVLKDIWQLTTTRKLQTRLPMLLFGHSMGSLFAQAALIEFGNLFAAAALTGITVDKPGRRALAPMLTRIVGLTRGSDKSSPFLDHMTFGSYNKPFQPATTAFDWLSRDAQEVRKYVEDPLCGFICTPALFHDVSSMLLFNLRDRNIDRIPKNLPILLMAGEYDPVGGPAAMEETCERYRRHGLSVESKIYPQARHELLNELCREEVTQDILRFYESVR